MRAQISPSQAALRTDSCGAFEDTSKNINVSSPKNIIEISKMRKLTDARREWENRHCSNSPFRTDRYGSSSSAGLENGSCEVSPMTIDRGYSLRVSIAKGDQYMSTQPLNFTNNKRSSF